MVYKYPYKKYNYSAFVGNLGTIQCREVSSKEFSNKSIEFDEIKVIDHSLIRKPGNVSYDNITLKSVEIQGKALYEWLTAVQTSAANRVHIRIVHVGDDQNCLASWMLLRAYPIKVTLYNFENSTDRPALESVVLGCEGLFREY